MNISDFIVDDELNECSELCMRPDPPNIRGWITREDAELLIVHLKEVFYL